MTKSKKAKIQTTAPEQLVETKELTPVSKEQDLQNTITELASALETLLSKYEDANDSLIGMSTNIQTERMFLTEKVAEASKSLTEAHNRAFGVVSALSKIQEYYNLPWYKKLFAFKKRKQLPSLFLNGKRAYDEFCASKYDVVLKLESLSNTLVATVVSTDN